MPPGTTWPCWSCGSERSPESHRESNVQDVALSDDVIAALHPQLALRLGGVPAARTHQVVERDDLRPDEPSLEVGVDDPGRLRGGGPPTHLPGPGLVLSRRE